jgi:hypothetical protein
MTHPFQPVQSTAKRVFAYAALVLLFVLFSSDGNSQSKSKRLLGSFIYGKNSFNYEFTMEANDSYSFSISSITVAHAHDDTTGEVDSAAASLFNEFSQNVFEQIFINQMKEKYRAPDSLVRKSATEVFFKIKAWFDFIDDEPTTAYLILKKDSIWSLLRVNSSKYYKGSLSEVLARHKIHRAEIETEDGGIKNISVYLVDPRERDNVSPRQFLLFKNQFPISISGKFDYEKTSKINLHCYNCNGIEGLSRYIRLSDLVILDIVYENDKEDYSPANRTFSLTPAKPIVALKKERRSRLLEIAAFSDFIGLDRNEPNGLIQIEAKRKIYITTKHRLLVRGEYHDKLARIDLDSVNIQKFDTLSGKYQVTDRTTGVTLTELGQPKSRFRSVYFNFFNYIEPRLLFSKLEETNRLLDSVKAINKTISPINLYQYQVATFGVKMQLFRLSFPQIKMQWNVLDVGAFWSRIRVALTADSAGPSAALNSNYWQFGTSVIFRPDNRWGASLGFEYLSPRIWNDEYERANGHGLFQQQFDAWLRTGDDGKLFFRYRWTYENFSRNNNFTQIQLGYSLNLFTGNKISDNKSE